MNPGRRTFIKNSTIAVSGALIFSNDVFAFTNKKVVLGIQLYSVRDDMKKDPAATLKKIAQMGYKNVEHANYKDRKFYGYTPKEFKKFLNDLGLKMPSGHTSLNASHWDAAKNDFTDEWKYTIDDAAEVGQHYVISPWLDEKLRTNYEDLSAFLLLFNKTGELCKKAGMKFGYHNHDFEFKNSLNNTKIFDIILNQTDPELVTQQLDIGNMYGAGGRAIEIMKKYPGRFELMHVKDEIKSSGKGEMNDGFESTVVGKGILDIKHVIDYAITSGGTTHFIIEQESYQGRAPIDCVKDDLKMMKSLHRF
jgi:sugar phosphate isomerase/epimerase